MHVVTVWTGNKYSELYVQKLANMVRRNLQVDHNFICLNDHYPNSYRNGIFYLPIVDRRLDKWWPKMWLFDRSYRERDQVLYFDLDTIILRDITYLTEFDAPFGICQNFARLAGKYWPCKYGSCCMILNPAMDSMVWQSFEKDMERWKTRARLYGDQWVIEQLYPKATYLQDKFPSTFISYRNLTDEEPDEDIVIFGGNAKPDNSPYDWVREAWA